MANHLPREMMFDIFSRLPVKDLLRCRCVSTAWRSSIDDPDLIKSHLNHSKQTNSNLGVVVLFKGNVFFRIDVDEPSVAVKLNHPNPIDASCGAKILGSCNGLVALVNSRKDTLLWNPSTRRYKKLPRTITDDVEAPPGFVLRESKNIYGLGYDPINNDYKLVRIIQFKGLYDNDPLNSNVYVYSAKENYWRLKYRYFPCFLNAHVTGNAVLVGNSLLWLLPSESESDGSKLIVAFDLVTEEFHEIPQPAYYEKTRIIHMDLAVLGGSLCVTCNYFFSDRHSCPRLDSKERVYEYLHRYSDFTVHTDIWVMKEYGVQESWTKLISIKPSKAIGYFNFVAPIGYLKNGAQVLLHQDFGKFTVYDLVSEKANRVRISGLPQKFETCLYVESVVGLDRSWDSVEGNRKKKNHEKQNLNAKQRYYYYPNRI